MGVDEDRLGQGFVSVQEVAFGEAEGTSSPGRRDQRLPYSFIAHLPYAERDMKA